MQMSNIKVKYWTPCLGIAFLMNDWDTQLNSKEESILLLYHVITVVTLISLGLFLIIA